jgi:DNA invertase Pin-like site-specific DNA recombinase
MKYTLHMDEGDRKQHSVRAGCYCRISSDPQDKREGVDRQKQDTSALCEVKGWIPADFYIDNDRSASNGKDRPEWDRLLADIRAERIDAIAAWDQDRGWRMMHELEELRRFFKSVGRQIPLATTGQGDIDLYSPTGVLAAQIKTAVSEHEIAMMKVRMRRAARQKAEQGIPHWKEAFGYLNHQPSPQTAPLVAAAYRAILAGSSLGDVARMLNASGVTTLTGKPWTARTLSLFLRKPRNAGLRAHHGEILGRGTWPPLVDEQTWRAAQDVLNAHVRPGRRTARKYLLTGMLQCGNCPGHLSGNKSSRGTSFYRCKSCLSVSIAASHIEPLVYKLVGGRLAKADAVDLLQSPHHDEAETEALRAQRMALATRLEEIANERADGLIDGQGYRAMTQRINAKMAELDARERDEELSRVLDGIPLGKPEVIAAVKGLTPDRFRAVMGLLIKVTVSPIGKHGGNRFDPSRVRIDWIFPA